MNKALVRDKLKKLFKGKTSRDKMAIQLKKLRKKGEPIVSLGRGKKKVLPRLRPGVKFTTESAELAALAQQARKTYPKKYADELSNLLYQIEQEQYAAGLGFAGSALGRGAIRAVRFGKRALGGAPLLKAKKAERHLRTVKRGARGVHTPTLRNAIAPGWAKSKAAFDVTGATKARDVAAQTARRHMKTRALKGAAIGVGGALGARALKRAGDRPKPAKYADELSNLLYQVQLVKPKKERKFTTGKQILRWTPGGIGKRIAGSIPGIRHITTAGQAGQFLKRPNLPKKNYADMLSTFLYAKKAPPISKAWVKFKKVVPREVIDSAVDVTGGRALAAKHLKKLRHAPIRGRITASMLNLSTKRLKRLKRGFSYAKECSANKEYTKRGIEPPNGKGIHTKKFHEISAAVMKDGKVKDRAHAHAIAMSKLGSKKGVKKEHQKKDYASPITALRSLRKPSFAQRTQRVKARRTGRQWNAERAASRARVKTTLGTIGETGATVAGLAGIVHAVKAGRREGPEAKKHLKKAVILASIGSIPLAVRGFGARGPVLPSRIGKLALGVANVPITAGAYWGIGRLASTKGGRMTRSGTGKKVRIGDTPFSRIVPIDSPRKEWPASNVKAKYCLTQLEQPENYVFNKFRFGWHVAGKAKNLKAWQRLGGKGSAATRAGIFTRKHVKGIAAGGIGTAIGAKVLKKKKEEIPQTHCLTNLEQPADYSGVSDFLGGFMKHKTVRGLRGVEKWAGVKKTQIPRAMRAGAATRRSLLPAAVVGTGVVLAKKKKKKATATYAMKKTKEERKKAWEEKGLLSKTAFLAGAGVTGGLVGGAGASGALVARDKWAKWKKRRRTVRTYAMKKTKKKIQPKKKMITPVQKKPNPLPAKLPPYRAFSFQDKVLHFGLKSAITGWRLGFSHGMEEAAGTKSPPGAIRLGLLKIIHGEGYVLGRQHALAKAGLHGGTMTNRTWADAFSEFMKELQQEEPDATPKVA